MRTRAYTLIGVNLTGPNNFSPIKQIFVNVKYLQVECLFCEETLITYLRTCVCACVRLCVCVRACMHVSMYCMYVCIYVLYVCTMWGSMH